jgi:aromatic ring-opening dioxygenase LigB subunit
MTGQHEAEVRVSAAEVRSHYWSYARIYYYYQGEIYPLHFQRLRRVVHITGDSEENDRMYVRTAKSLRTMTLSRCESLNIACLDRKDGLKIARFFDKKWW